ncbi:MAG: peptide deformylase [Planctomycetota bacterium]
MAVREVLLLGNPRLYERSLAVERSDRDALEPSLVDLHDTLMDFRRRYQAGRAIAAPQIGVFRRVVYLHLGEPMVIINPRLTRTSPDLIEVWDDCMCFPDLLVRVLRHRACRLTFHDASWRERSLDLEDDLAELVQHEVDHLDGVLAVSRAIDARSFALRSERTLVRRFTS